MKFKLEESTPIVDELFVWLELGDGRVTIMGRHSARSPAFNFTLGYLDVDGFHRAQGCNGIGLKVNVKGAVKDCGEYHI